MNKCLYCDKPCKRKYVKKSTKGIKQELTEQERQRRRDRMIEMNNLVSAGLKKHGTLGHKWSEDFKKSMSIKQKGRIKTRKERKDISKRMKGKNHFNYGKSYSLELKQKLSKSQKNRWIKLSIEEKKKLTEKLLEGREKAGWSKWYEFEGFRVQGKFELCYLISLKVNNKILPLNKGKRFYIDTPFGRYLPDFEFEDKFVEIKSGYTFKKFIGKQIKKINWVSKNVKKVEIKILNDKDIKEYMSIANKFTPIAKVI